jgi:hypothetical protein
MISMHLIAASIRTRSRLRLSRSLPRAKDAASRLASNMWRKRTRSLGGILNGGRTQDFVAEIWAEFAQCSQVNFACE